MIYLLEFLFIYLFTDKIYVISKICKRKKHYSFMATSVSKFFRFDQAKLLFNSMEFVHFANNCETCFDYQIHGILCNKVFVISWYPSVIIITIIKTIEVKWTKIVPFICCWNRYFNLFCVFIYIYWKFM